jgi:hypothetical protein
VSFQVSVCSIPRLQDVTNVPTMKKWYSSKLSKRGVYKMKSFIPFYLFNVIRQFYVFQILPTAVSFFGFEP